MPKWMAYRTLHVGVTPINNFGCVEYYVDIVLNYTMLLAFGFICSSGGGGGGGSSSSSSSSRYVGSIRPCTSLRAARVRPAPTGLCAAAPPEGSGGGAAAAPADGAHSEHAPMRRHGGRQDPQHAANFGSGATVRRAGSRPS